MSGLAAAASALLARGAAATMEVARAARAVATKAERIFRVVSSGVVGGWKKRGESFQGGNLYLIIAQHLDRARFIIEPSRWATGGGVTFLVERSTGADLEWDEGSAHGSPGRANPTSRAKTAGGPARLRGSGDIYLSRTHRHRDGWDVRPLKCWRTAALLGCRSTTVSADVRRLATVLQVLVGRFAFGLRAGRGLTECSMGVGARPCCVALRAESTHEYRLQTGTEVTVSGTHPKSGQVRAIFQRRCLPRALVNGDKQRRGGALVSSLGASARSPWVFPEKHHNTVTPPEA